MAKLLLQEQRAVIEAELVLDLPLHDYGRYFGHGLWSIAHAWCTWLGWVEVAVLDRRSHYHGYWYCLFLPHAGISNADQDVV